jgi:branched-chain amino acid transport system permease protein
MFDWGFTLVLVTNGVLIGLMYSLIALGFVLVYKATDAINFAQGEFVMLAGFIVAGMLVLAGAPFWLGVAVAVLGMVAFGFGLERVVLRPLIGRPIIAVIMATIGLATVLRGAAPLFFGAETRSITLPISDEPFAFGPFTLPPVLAGASSASLSRRLHLVLPQSRMGVAMRAVADNQGSLCDGASTSSATSPSPGAWRGSSRRWAGSPGARCSASTCTSPSSA